MTSMSKFRIYKTLFLGATLLFVSCGSIKPSDSDYPLASDSPATAVAVEAQDKESSSTYIALLAAYEGEFTHLLSNVVGLDIERIEQINGVKFYVGKAHGESVLLFETGIGLVNAAMTLQIALDHFEVSHILFSGVAGGIDPALKKGDLSIASQWHYSEYGARFTADDSQETGYRVPEFMQSRISDDHINEFFPYPKTVLRDGLETPQRMPFFETDPALLEIAAAAAKEVSLVNALGEPATILTNTVGGSGLAFNDNAEIADFMWNHWGSASVDMESAALAQVAWVNRVPILQVRAISDLVGNDNPNEFYEYKSVAEANASKLVNEILKAMAAEAEF